MNDTEFDELMSLLGSRWPKWCDDLANAITRKKLADYPLGDTRMAVIGWLADNTGARQPDVEAIRRLVHARTRSIQAEPTKWTWADEANLGHCLARFRPRVAAGKLPEQYADADWVARNWIGKTAGQYERQAAMAILDKHLESARVRMRERGASKESIAKLGNRDW